MANALAEPQAGTTTFTPSGFERQYLVTFAGPDVSTGTQQTGTQVAFDYDDTIETLRNKVRQAVLVSAQEFGFTVTTIQADVPVTV